MTHATCTDLDLVHAPKTSGMAARLFAALGRLRPAERLDLDSLSCHQLRDLGLTDGRDGGPRDCMWD